MFIVLIESPKLCDLQNYITCQASSVYQHYSWRRRRRSIVYFLIFLMLIFLFDFFQFFFLYTLSESIVVDCVSSLYRHKP